MKKQQIKKNKKNTLDWNKVKKEHYLIRQDNTIYK